MTDAEKKMKRYVKAVERRLNLPRKVRARVMSDFLSDIAARREGGMTDEEILSQLGSPKAAAAELNEQMRAFAYRKSPWRFVCLALAVIGGLCLGAEQLILWHFHHAILGGDTIAIIGGADGPTSIFVWATYTGIHLDRIVLTVMLVGGLLGFWLLGRRKPKKEDS